MGNLTKPPFLSIALAFALLSAIRPAIAQGPGKVPLRAPRWVAVEPESLSARVKETIIGVLGGDILVEVKQIAADTIGGHHALLVLSRGGRGTGLRVGEYWVLWPAEDDSLHPSLLWSQLEFREIYGSTRPEPVGRWQGCLYLAGDSAIGYVFSRTGGYSRQRYWEEDAQRNRSGYFKLMAPEPQEGLVYWKAPDAALMNRCRKQIRGRRDD
jgi:hypothetical protein